MGKTVVQSILACWICCPNYLSSPLISPIFRFPRRVSGPRLSTSQIASGFGEKLSRHHRLSARGNAKLPWQTSLGSEGTPKLRTATPIRLYLIQRCTASSSISKPYYNFINSKMTHSIILRITLALAYFSTAWLPIMAHEYEGSAPGDATRILLWCSYYFPASTE